MDARSFAVFVNLASVQWTQGHYHEAVMTLRNAGFSQEAITQWVQEACRGAAEALRDRLAR